MNLSEELKSKAISLGLCQQWQSEWGKPNKKELINKFVKGIDFAIAHDFPSVEFINANFTKQEMRECGVFCDDDTFVKAPTMVFMGESKGEVNFGDFDVTTVYVRHNSNLHITISRYASVIIKVFDNAKVFVDNKGFYKSRIYNYSDDSKVTYYGSVLVKKRNFSDIYAE